MGIGVEIFLIFILLIHNCFMKRSLIILFVISLTLPCLNAQSEKEIKAEMKHVTVFPDRAQIDHETSVPITPGKSVLKLSSLSPYIDPQSVRVKGTGDFTILSVNHQNNYLQNLEESADIKNLRSQLESLQLKAEDEKAAIAVLKEKEAFLVANRAILVKETTFSVEQLKSVMELYTSNMDQVTMSILKKGRLIKDFEKQISALQQQISDRLGKQNLPSGEIYITINSDKPVTGKLYFSYVVMNAGWYPSYDIRVDDIKNPVTIFYKANVYQNSGVAWKDVKLSFSNATPWIAGDIPALYPWFIDYYIVMPLMSKGRAAGVSRDAAPVAMEAMKVKEESVELEAAPPPVQKQTGETTITFDIDLPYSVPSDGKIQTVEIQRLTAPAEYKYVTLPKLSQHAYLTANLNDWAKLSLQTGEATLYFENTYVGKSMLDINQLTDTLTLSLGTDNSILVKSVQIRLIIFHLCLQSGTISLQVLK
jgi:uncharacterized protein (TIGR02231 family)